LYLCGERKKITGMRGMPQPDVSSLGFACLAARSICRLPADGIANVVVQPFGKIPVLEDPELGVTIFESRSILRCASMPLKQLHSCDVSSCPACSAGCQCLPLALLVSHSVLPHVMLMSAVAGYS
jgi:hypothetical protein